MGDCERARNSECPVSPIMVEMLQSVQRVNESVIDVDSILRSHMNDHESHQKTLENIVGSIRLEIAHALRGFPNDDPQSHREYHEAKITEIKNRAEFWKKMTFELSKAGLLGFLVWAGYAMWNAFLHGPK